MPEPYRVVNALPSGTAFSRFLMVKAAARGDVLTELALADKLKDTPTVHATIELQTKAAVSPGLTSNATWAGPLSVYGVAAEALALVRGTSIIGALENAARAVSNTRGARNFHGQRRRVGGGRAGDPGRGDQL